MCLRRCLRSTKGAIDSPSCEHLCGRDATEAVLGVANYLKGMVRLAGFEPATCCSGVLTRITAGIGSSRSCPVFMTLWSMSRLSPASPANSCISGRMKRVTSQRRVSRSFGLPYVSNAPVVCLQRVVFRDSRTFWDVSFDSSRRCVLPRSVMLRCKRVHYNPLSICCQNEACYETRGHLGLGEGEIVRIRGTAQGARGTPEGHLAHAWGPCLEGALPAATASQPVAKPSLPESSSAPNGGNGPAKPPTDRTASPSANNNGNGSPASSGFNQLRNDFPTAARRVATTKKQPIGEVVEWASGATFKYGDIGRMTEADIMKLRAATELMASGPVGTTH